MQLLYERQRAIFLDQTVFLCLYNIVNRSIGGHQRSSNRKPGSGLIWLMLDTAITTMASSISIWTVICGIRYLVRHEHHTKR